MTTYVSFVTGEMGRIVQVFTSDQPLQAVQHLRVCQSIRSLGLQLVLLDETGTFTELESTQGIEELTGGTGEIVGGSSGQWTNVWCCMVWLHLVDLGGVY